jgi:hypothetical protein
LKLYNGIDHNISYWKTTVRPFTYLVVPAVFWVIATYGIVPTPTRCFLTCSLSASEPCHSTTHSPL